MSNPNNDRSFEDLIEKNVHLPKVPSPEGEIFEDNFRLKTNIFDDLSLKSILLPRYILNPNQSIKEKSFILLVFYGTHKPNAYERILLAAKEGLPKFEIHFLSEHKKNKVVSVWKFYRPHIHAIDFGYVAHIKTEPAEISVEIEYDELEIEGNKF